MRRSVLFFAAASAAMVASLALGGGPTVAVESTDLTLPAEPRVLYEWFPAGSGTKSIIVSDEELAAPPVQVVPETQGAAVHASWSRDGSQFTWEVLQNDDTASVWTASADGSDPLERVVCQGAPCVEMSYPAFSPDGSQLLVTRFDLADDGDWGASHLVVVDLASGEQTIIASTEDGTTAFYSGTWSPDGNRVAAALETYTDATETQRIEATIVVVDTDPDTPEAPTAVTDPGLAAGYPRWHPTDDRILFASWDLDANQGAEPSQLYTVAPDGSGLTQITDVDYTTTWRRPGEASWTPDGQRIIASIGIVQGDRVVDVKVSWVDPATGEITETEASGAMPALQPMEAVTVDGQAEEPLELVVIGDSIPFAGFCPGCVGFVEQWGRELQDRTGRPVEIRNRSRDDSADMAAIRDQALGDEVLRSEIADAEAIIVSVGYNTVVPDPDLGLGCLGDYGSFPDGYIAWALANPTTCQQAFFDAHAATYDEIFSAINELRDGAPTVVAVLDVHNGNKDDPAFTSATVSDATMADFQEWLTGVYDGWNSMLCDRATEAGFSCVDAYHAFNGPNGREPSRPWTVDGAHPNQAGNDLIAELLAGVDLSALEAVPGGSVIEAELGSDEGRLIWEILVRSMGGRSEVYVDATSGELLKV
jgi:GDSL-like Lipase/Acylhydrolase family/Peptidase propeptide and YPEB domain